MTLELALKNLLRDVVREAVRDELGNSPTRGPSAEFLTYGEAAKHVRVSLATIKRWVSAGRLQAFGVGRVKRVKAAEVEACLRGQRVARRATTDDERVVSILDSLKGGR